MTTLQNAGAGNKILLVEDEPSIRDNLVWSLESEGFIAEACGTCGEALRALESGVFALAIVDVGLPDGSGFDLCRQMRSVSALPVIFLTARGSEIDRVVGLEIGGDDYVTKPFSPRELTARVRAVLRRVSDSAPEGRPLTGAFVVDEARCKVSYHGRSLDLSRYEYRLLRVFVENPGRVFSRSQLMDRAWEEPDASLERTVDSHIKSLRAKLHAIRADLVPIRTHRGLGYSLDEDACR